MKVRNFFTYIVSAEKCSLNFSLTCDVVGKRFNRWSEMGTRNVLIKLQKGSGIFFVPRKGHQRKES